MKSLAAKFGTFLIASLLMIGSAFAGQGIIEEITPDGSIVYVQGEERETLEVFNIDGLDASPGQIAFFLEETRPHPFNKGEFVTRLVLREVSDPR